MDVSQPIKSVIPGAYADVLTVLARTAESLTGRQIADLTNGSVSQPRVNAILGELARAGVASRTKKGQSYLYAMNREHLASDAIEQLVSMRSRLMESIGAVVSAWDEPPVSVWLFGSAARGDGSPASDIDLLLVRPDAIDEYSRVWESQVDDLVENVLRWTGNDCRVVQYGEDELRALVANGERLFSDVKAEGLLLFGDRHPLFTRRAG